MHQLDPKQFVKDAKLENRIRKMSGRKVFYGQNKN